MNLKGMLVDSQDFLPASGCKNLLMLKMCCQINEMISNDGIMLFKILVSLIDLIFAIMIAFI